MPEWLEKEVSGVATFSAVRHGPIAGVTCEYFAAVEVRQSDKVRSVKDAMR